MASWLKDKQVHKLDTDASMKFFKSKIVDREGTGKGLGIGEVTYKGKVREEGGGVWLPKTFLVGGGG